MKVKINERKLRNNTQKVLVKLLSCEGKWVKNKSFRVPSAGSRIRDLRTKDFGNFFVECKPASKLGIVGDQYTFYYRLKQSKANTSRALRVFKEVIRTR